MTTRAFYTCYILRKYHTRYNGYQEFRSNVYLRLFNENSGLPPVCITKRNKSINATDDYEDKTEMPMFILSVWLRCLSHPTLKGELVTLREEFNCKRRHFI